MVGRLMGSQLGTRPGAPPEQPEVHGAVLALQPRRLVAAGVASSQTKPRATMGPGPSAVGTYAGETEARVHKRCGPVHR